MYEIRYLLISMQSLQKRKLNALLFECTNKL